MKTYTFIIGSMDDFEGIEDLIDYVDQEGRDGSLNYSCHEFEVHAECDEETVTLIGRGIAFSNDWCMDHTLSFLVTGALETEAEKDMIQRGVDARESQKESRRVVGAVHPANDPVNW
jgi:hypothetical protein